MQRVYHRIPTVLLCGVPRRQEDQHFPVDIITLKVSFQSPTVDLYSLNGDWFRPRDDRGTFRFNLSRRHCGNTHGKSENPKNPVILLQV